jgi:integrase
VYADYVVNQRKSLRHDAAGNPHLDKVVRLDGFFSGYRASEIDADRIRKFIREEQTKGLSNGSINRSISALRRMFNLAKEDGKVRDLPHFPMVKEAPPRKGFLERDGYEKLLAALPTYLRLHLAIGYFTGMREGEILGLNWDQVKFLTGTIELLAGETKNDEAREIPIIPQLRALLVEQHARRQPGCPYAASGSTEKAMPSESWDSARHGILLVSGRGSGRWSLRLTGLPTSRSMHPRADRGRSRRQRWFIEERFFTICAA